MNRLCKTYISNVKVMFPVMGKSEKRYVKTLSLNVDDFLEDATESSLETLYKEFGRPEEVIKEYYDNTDTEKIIKRIKVSKYKRRFFGVLAICLLISTVVFNYMLYSEHQAFMRESEIIKQETTIK